GLERSDRGFSTRTGSLHSDVKRPHADRLGGVAGIERCLRRCKRRPLTRSLEADTSSARPGYDVSFGVRDRDHGVVEGRLHVCEAVVNDALLAALLEGLLALTSTLFFLWCCAFRCRCFALCHSQVTIDDDQRGTRRTRRQPCLTSACSAGSALNVV